MSKSRPQQALAVVAAMLMVATAVGGAVGPAAAPVGTASAQSATNDECSTWDSLIYDALTVGNLNTDGDNPCSAEYQRQQLADEWNETDAKETRTQIHSQAGQLAASNEQFATVMQNGLRESETIAFSKGEAAAVEVLGNGGTLAEAKAAANDSIDDYYAVKEINTWDRWEVVVETTDTLDKRAYNTSGVSSEFFTVGDEDDFGDSFDTSDQDYSSDKGLGYAEIVGDPTTGTVQLVNGTTIGTQTIPLKLQFWDSGVKNYQRKIGPSRITSGNWNVSVPVGTVRLSHIRVRSTSNLSSQRVDLTEFGNIIRKIHDKNKETKREVAVYIDDSLGPAVKNGSLDAESYVSSATLAQEYAQDYNGSDGYVRALSIAASSGMSTPDLENTASMKVIHDGETHTGMLLSQNGPENDTWESSQTYDPSVISGLQFFAVEGENGTVIELDGPFTIKSIEGMDGGEIETAETQQVKYVTSNASADYSELQEQIRTLQAEIELQKERATAPPAGGGGGGGGPSLPSWLSWLPGGWGGALAGLAAGGGVLALGGLVIGAVLLGIVVKVAL